MAVSPICTVQDGAGAPQATTNGAVVTAGNVVTIALASTSGVNSWSLTLFGQDELVTPPTVTVNNTNKTATFTAPALPWSLIYKSVVNNGIDVNGQPQASYSATFKICCLTAGGKRLLAVNETTENDSTYGWTGIGNIGPRGGGGGSTTTTGTGLWHNVAGVLNAASSLVVDADVSASAAIQGTKLVPTFGAQAVTGSSYDINSAGSLTIGGVATGLVVSLSATTVATWASTGITFLTGYVLNFGTTNLPTTGKIRFQSGLTDITARNNANSADLVLLATTAADHITIGDTTNTVATDFNTAAGGAYNFNIGGAQPLSIAAASFQTAAPFSGSSFSGTPFRFTVSTAVAIPTTGTTNTTPSAAQLSNPHLVTTGALTANQNCILPTGSSSGAIYFIDNQCTNAFTVTFMASGQTGVAVASGKKCIIMMNSAGTDYVRWTPDT